MKKLLIAEDHKFIIGLIARGLQQRYHLIPAYNGKELLDSYVVEKPDVILADIDLPVLDGLTASKEIRKVDTAVKIIIITCKKEKYIIKEALRIGVNAVIIKDDDEFLERTINEALIGDRIYLSPTAAKILAGSNKHFSLTLCEARVLKLIKDGLNTKQIAGMLFNSVNTIKNHKKNIFRKLQAHNTAQAIAASNNIYLPTQDLRQTGPGADG